MTKKELKEELKLSEIRLTSNISFLEWILKNYGNLDLRRDSNELENGEPKDLTDIILDLDSIRNEIDNLQFNIKL